AFASPRSSRGPWLRTPQERLFSRSLPRLRFSVVSAAGVAVSASVFSVSVYDAIISRLSVSIALLNLRCFMRGIARLAKELGISTGTVSRALNGRPDVSEATRELVLATAKRLGYAPNQAARTLALGATRSIGFMMD